MELHSDISISPEQARLINDTREFDLMQRSCRHTVHSLRNSEMLQIDRAEFGLRISGNRINRSTASCTMQCLG